MKAFRIASVVQEFYSKIEYIFGQTFMNIRP